MCIKFLEYEILFMKFCDHLGRTLFDNLMSSSVPQNLLHKPSSCLSHET